jgi:hypothetical protein
MLNVDFEKNNMPSKCPASECTKGIYVCVAFVGAQKG